MGGGVLKNVIFQVTYFLKGFLVNDNHREKLYFTQFSARIYWNRSLAASELFLIFTQSIKLYAFHCHTLKSTNVWKKWFSK